MPRASLGNVLLIANPAAHSGRGADAVRIARHVLESQAQAYSTLQVVSTQAKGDAIQLAAEAARFDTVLALGGDGIIHEVVNGLMQLPREARPTLGIIPVGSGNDFARTLHLQRNDPAASIAQLLKGAPYPLDLGYVSSDAGEATFFAQTLSFGTDAAIALDTTTRRANDAKQQGAGLFATSGLRLIGEGGLRFDCDVSIDGGRARRLPILIFAVQNGPTYGGGFKVCPKAKPDDGVLDTCFNVRTASVPHFLQLFLAARLGRHARSKTVELHQLHTLSADFLGKEPPCQVDGEQLHGTKFKVRVEPAALRVIF